MRNQYHLEKQWILQFHGSGYKGINWVDSKKGRVPTAKVTHCCWSPFAHIKHTTTNHSYRCTLSLSTSGNQLLLSSSSLPTMVNPRVSNHYVTNRELWVEELTAEVKELKVRLNLQRGAKHSKKSLSAAYEWSQEEVLLQILWWHFARSICFLGTNSSTTSGRKTTAERMPGVSQP